MFKQDLLNTKDFTEPITLILRFILNLVFMAMFCIDSPSLEPYFNQARCRRQERDD
jgi:hypothetical protein